MGNGSELFIGGYRNNGAWSWVNDEGDFDSFNQLEPYANWEANEPNSLGEQYATIGRFGDGRWNDSNGASGYVIEYDRFVPQIFLVGDSVLRHRQGTAFVDPGATATDEEDGNVSVVSQGVVDVHTLGDFKIQYTAVDSEGNAAKPVIRIVRIVDAEKPIIDLNGPAYLTHETGTQYSDQGASATDLDGNDVVVTGPATWMCSPWVAIHSSTRPPMARAGRPLPWNAWSRWLIRISSI